MGSLVTAIFKFFDRDFLRTPVNLLLSSPKCQGVRFFQSIKIIYFCSGPISPQPWCGDGYAPRTACMRVRQARHPWHVMWHEATWHAQRRCIAARCTSVPREAMLNLSTMLQHLYAYMCRLHIDIRLLRIRLTDVSRHMPHSPRVAKLIDRSTLDPTVYSLTHVIKHIKSQLYHQQNKPCPLSIALSQHRSEHVFRDLLLKHLSEATNQWLCTVLWLSRRLIR